MLLPFCLSPSALVTGRRNNVALHCVSLTHYVGRIPSLCPRHATSPVSRNKKRTVSRPLFLLLPFCLSPSALVTGRRNNVALHCVSLTHYVGRIPSLLKLHLCHLLLLPSFSSLPTSCDFACKSQQKEDCFTSSFFVASLLLVALCSRDGQTK